MRYNTAKGIVDVHDVFRTFLTEASARSQQSRLLPPDKVPKTYVKWNGDGRDRRVLPIADVAELLQSMKNPMAKYTATVLLKVLSVDSQASDDGFLSTDTPTALLGKTPSQDNNQLAIVPRNGTVGSFTDASMVSTMLSVGAHTCSPQMLGEWVNNIYGLNVRYSKAHCERIEQSNEYMEDMKRRNDEFADYELEVKKRKIDRDAEVAVWEKKYEVYKRIGRDDLAEGALTALNNI